MSYRPFYKDVDGKLYTQCEHCKFLENGNCKLGRLDIWKSQGKNYKVRNGFPEINAICNTFRPPTYEGTEEDAYREVEIKADLLVLVMEDTTDFELEHTMRSVASSDLKPAKVYFVNLSTRDQLDLVDFVKKQEEFNNVQLWSVVQHRQYKSLDYLSQAIDNAVLTGRNDYYCVFKAGTEVPWSYLRERDNCVNHKLSPEVFLHSNDFPEFTFVYRELHNAIGGWSPAKFTKEDGSSFIVNDIREKVKLFNQKEVEKCT